MPSVTGRHKGETIFVFGTGLSLELALPHKERLSEYLSIGVSNAFLTIPVSYTLLIDPGTYESHRDGYINLTHEVFCPTEWERVPCYPIPTHWTRFARYRPLERKLRPLAAKFEQGLRWSRSVCVPAINLAYLMGASRIVLLGVDLNSNAHVHDKVTGANDGFPFPEYIVEDMDNIYDYLTRRGVECVNCSPESLVKSWPYKELREML